MKYINKLTVLFFLISFSVSLSQEKLTKETAVNIALENNYGIKIAKNIVEVVKSLSGRSSIGVNLHEI